MWWKSFLKYVGFLCGFLTMLFIPFIVELLIDRGIFGYKFPNSIFTDEQWFAFWGSYIGSIITVVVLFVSIRLNKKDMKNSLQDYELQMEYERIKKNIAEIHCYLNLNKSFGESMDDVTMIYSVKLMSKHIYGLMNECNISDKFQCKIYMELAMQVLYEYLMEIDKVPKTLDGIDMANAANIYKQATKELIKIKHKYVQKENFLYDETIREISKSLYTGRKKVYGV